MKKLINQYIKAAEYISNKTAYLLCGISAIIFVSSLAFLDSDWNNIALFASLAFSLVSIVVILKALFPSYVKIYTRGFKLKERSAEEWRKLGFRIAAFTLPVALICFAIGVVLYLL